MAFSKSRRLGDLVTNTDGDLTSAADVDITGGTLQLASGSNRRLFYRPNNADVLLEADSGLFYRQDIDNTHHSWFTGNSERMRIATAGELSLGVTANNVGGAGDINMKGNQAIRWMHATDGTQYGDMYVDTSNNVVFRNGSSSTERMRIDASGDVGIGSSNPQNNIHVLGNSGSPSVGITLQTHDAANATATLSLLARDASNVNQSVNIQNDKGNLYIDSNVGIGDASPSAKLEISGSANSTYLIAGGDDATNLRGLKFTSSPSTNFNGAIHTINAPSVDGELAFATNNTERARVNDYGITFHGDTAPANALYDYEEGTWNPTIIGSSGASGQSYQLQNGYYVKIGSLVHLTFDVWLSTVGTLSGGYVLLHNHGFTFKGSNLGGSCITGYNANIGTMTDYPVTGYINGGSIYLMKASNGYMTPSGSNVLTNFRIIGSITGTV